MEAMEALRSTNQHGKAGSTASSGTAGSTPPSQGLAALLVMIAVLCFIVAYCCWGAPCCRAFCRRRCCHFGTNHDMEASPSDIGLSVDQGMGATPTIILLPYGRMLVVDGTVFAQLQAGSSGLDLLELSENMIRAHQRASALGSLADSTPSILDVDSETTSKNGYLSPLTGLPPPTYNEIFGSCYIDDLPPTYEEILPSSDTSREEEVAISEVCHEYSETDVCPAGECRVPLDEYNQGEIRESQV